MLPRRRGREDREAVRHTTSAIACGRLPAPALSPVRASPARRRRCGARLPGREKNRGLAATALTWFRSWHGYLPLFLPRPFGLHGVTIITWCRAQRGAARDQLPEAQGRSRGYGPNLAVLGLPGVMASRQFVLLTGHRNRRQPIRHRQCIHRLGAVGRRQICAGRIIGMSQRTLAGLSPHRARGRFHGLTHGPASSRACWIAGRALRHGH